MSTTVSSLPNECWEYVFRFLDEHSDLESLSLVCKQFLFVTNRFGSSLTVCDLTLPFLPHLFLRFPTVTSLDLTHFRGDLDVLLEQISHSSLDLKSLKISDHSTIPTNGFRALAKKMETLTSLTCSNMGSLKNADMLLIAACFPFLEELDLSLTKGIGDESPNTFNVPTSGSAVKAVYYTRDISNGPVSDFGVKALSLALPKLRKVNLSGNFFINDASLFILCKNCEFLEEVLFFDCYLITQRGIASAIRERPHLRSLSVNHFGKGAKSGDSRRPHVTHYFIEALVSLESLTCLVFLFSSISDELLAYVANIGLPLRKLVLRGCSNYRFVGINYLLRHCPLIQHLDLQNAEFLNDKHVAMLSKFLGHLISINLSGCRITDSAFFALVGKCPLLDEIKMEGTDIGKEGLEDSNSLMDFVENPQVKSLHLAHNSSLSEESIKIFVSICPNLQLLDLSYCLRISKGIVEVLRTCPNIRHLNLASCSGVQLHGMNFEMPKLEVLNLSCLGIDDETLTVISKSCCRLVHLNLERCSDITAKGVRQVVENCTQLREINLGHCGEVTGNVVIWMAFSRPSLRKIIAPPLFGNSDGQWELLQPYGCLVCQPATPNSDVLELHPTTHNSNVLELLQRLKC